MARITTNERTTTDIIPHIDLNTLELIMGASASIDLSSKESILGVKDVKEIMSALQINTSEFFSFDNIYLGLRMKESGVLQSELVSILSDKCEQEVFVLFLKYCGCEMTEAQFLEFCRSMKLLSRRDFSVDKASQLFKAKAYADRTAIEFKINYRVFRFDILPEISSAKGRSIRELVNKFCWTVLPTDDIQSKHHVVRGMHNNILLSAEAEKKAVICLQNFYRGVLARRYLHEELEIKYLEGCPSPTPTVSSVDKPPVSNRDIEIVSQKLVFAKGDFFRGVPCSSPVPGSSHAKLSTTVALDDQDARLDYNSLDSQHDKSRCNEIFLKFCSNGLEMTGHDFVRFCYDTVLIPFEENKVDFTAMQARHLFRRVVALHFDPERNVYEDGVVFGKRISFDVFWRVVLPDVANKKGLTLSAVVSHICNNSGIKRMYTSSEGPPVVSLLASREFMNSRCDSFESVLCEDIIPLSTRCSN